MTDQDPILTEAERSAGSIPSRLTATDPASAADSLRTQAPPSYPETQAGTDPGEAGPDDSMLTRFPVDPFATSEPDSSPAIGRRARPWGSIPGYERLELVGEGGMGAVYRARQVGLNRTDALKMVLGGAGPARRT